MKTIVVRTQAELDALPDSFKEYTIIEIRGGTAADYLVVKKARESSHVVAWDSSHVVARESSHVVARESSHVVAWESSHVVARESSHVVARGSSHVEAWGSSHVVAWGSSHVEARGSVSVQVFSDSITALLFGFSVAFAHAKAKITKKSKTATIITPKTKPGTDAWLESQGIEPKASVTLYKRVSKDFKTCEGTDHETLWAVGSTLEHPAWNPEKEECGAGKFHACSTAYFCDEFRDTEGDRYIAIKVAKKDLYAWPNPQYPHKVALRKAVVLYECDRYGKKKENADAL